MKEIIIQADALSLEVQQAQRLSEARNAAIRQAERQAAYDAWKDPEEMARRKKASDEAAAASLAYLQSLMAPEEEIPLPDPLPPEMFGQPMSTIKKMLKHQKYGEAYSPVRTIEFTAEAHELGRIAEQAIIAAISTSAKPVEKVMNRLAAEAFTTTEAAPPVKLFDQTVTVVRIEKAPPEKKGRLARLWAWLTTPVA